MERSGPPPRQLLVRFYGWVMPAAVLISLLIVPSFVPRSLLWDSIVADIAFRALISLGLAGIYRFLAKGFEKPSLASTSARQPSITIEVRVINWLIVGIVAGLQVLAGVTAIGGFTLFAIESFIPSLEQWKFIIALTNVSLVILPWIEHGHWEAPPKGKAD